MPQKSADATRTGAERLVETLEVLGVEVVFGLPGVHNLPIWRALAGTSIRLVTVRHEQAAAYAADGYTRVTGRLGVCLVTTGPGAANVLGGTGEAMASGSPILVIATDIPSHLRRAGVYRGVLHETRDQRAMFVPVVKDARTVASADDIAAEVLRAALVARDLPTGPAYLGIPTDLLSQPAPSSVSTQTNCSEPPLPSDSELSAASTLLGSAKNPLIWAGGGAARASAGPAVAELAERLVAPVITTYMGRGLLPADHPCHVPGSPLLREVGCLWDEADLVVAIGTDFDGTMTQNWLMPSPPHLLAVNIDARDAAKNYVPDLTLVGDAHAVTRLLAQRTPTRGGLERLRTRLQAVGEEIRHTVSRDDEHALAFLDAMKDLLPSDAVLMLDMCIPGYWLVSFHPVAGPRQMHYPVGWGTLGFGFPAALGAAIGAKGRVVCVTGDGGFLYACGELATAAQEQLPITVVLVDDGGYGMLRFDQIHAGEEPFGVDWRSPDFVGLARSFGVDADIVEGFGDAFSEKLKHSLNARGPCVLVVRANLRPPPTTYPRWYRRVDPPPSREYERVDVAG